MELCTSLRTVTTCLTILSSNVWNWKTCPSLGKCRLANILDSIQCSFRCAAQSTVDLHFGYVIRVIVTVKTFDAIFLKLFQILIVSFLDKYYR